MTARGDAADGAAASQAAGVPLNRALSKLGILSRAQATEAIRAGRVRVNNRVIVDPAFPVIPERARIEVDGQRRWRERWRTLLVHKPRGVVTTRRDPEGRRTVFDLLGDEGHGLVAVGRLDMATTGLLFDPRHGVPRLYVATVRGKVTESDLARLQSGVTKARDRRDAHAVVLRKASARESHLTVELREGKNREVRRLFQAIGHEVTRLKRVKLGGLELGTLEPGEWREISRAEIADAFRRPRS